MSTRTNTSSLRRRLTQRLLRPRLAYADPLRRLALLGVAAGAVTGVVVSLFRLALDFAALAALEGDIENFESLSPAMTVVLPLVGALVIGLVLTRGWRTNAGEPE